MGGAEEEGEKAEEEEEEGEKEEKLRTRWGRRRRS